MDSVVQEHIIERNSNLDLDNKIILGKETKVFETLYPEDAK